MTLSIKSHKLIFLLVASIVSLAVTFYFFMSSHEDDFTATVRGVSFTVALDLDDKWKVSRSRTPARPDSVSLAEVSMGDRRVFVMVGTADSPLLSMLTSLPLDDESFELQTDSSLFPVIEFSSGGHLFAASMPLQSPFDSNLSLVVILSGTVVDRDRAIELARSVDFEYTPE